MEDVLLAYQGDHLDNYRQEINEIITKQYEQDERNFKIENMLFSPQKFVHETSQQRVRRNHAELCQSF